MRILSKVFMTLSALSFAVPAFAQGGEAANPTNWVAALTGIAMAIAAAGCGLGQGRAAAAATEGIARLRQGLLTVRPLQEYHQSVISNE